LIIGLAFAAAAGITALADRHHGAPDAAIQPR
jgi:hypothetical protein